MAEALFEDFLTCPVCLEPLKQPVTLGCHHSFCSSCLHNSWDQNQTRSCPVCRRRSSKDTVEVNFALRELSLSFCEQQKAKETKVCSTHPEVPPLFCKDEARALCPVCEFSLHTQHTVVSGEEAERELREQLRSQLQALRDRRERVSSTEKLYQDMVLHSEEQAAHCESQIRALFDRLHRFLKEEEERRLAALREEQHRQTLTLGPELRSIREQLSSLSQSIRDLEQQLQKDTWDFLKVSNTKAQAKASQADPQPKEGLLLNQAKVLGNLGFRVWRRMRSLVQYSPVVLDPNTAEGSLYLSQDLCGVRHGVTRTLPIIPERFTNEPMVLGSDGFSSGTHQWDVEVGDLPTWDIGVVKKSVDRRGQIYAGASYGIWCLWHGEGKYDNGYGQKIPVSRPPEKIRVKLDYDGGVVSFYDADHITLLLTHRATFTETLFPYLSVGPTPGARTKEVRICSSGFY